MNIESLIDENGVLRLPEEAVLDGKLIYKLDELGNNSFDCLHRMIELHIPASVLNIQWSFWECYNLCRFVVDENNHKYSSIDGVLYSKDHNQLVAYPNAHGKEYSVVDGTVEVAHFAFKSCKAIEKIHLPESLRKIGNNAFYGCDSLKTVHLPDGIKHIGHAVGNSRYNFKYLYKGKEYSHSELSELLPE